MTPDPASTLRGRDRLLVALVPVLVVAVAAVGTWRYLQVDQSAWRGGAMGMFAVVDAPANRLVRGVLEEGGGAGGEPRRLVVLPPPEAGRAAELAQVVPTPGNLRALAERWGPAEERGRLVRIEVYRTVFEVDDRPAVRLELVSSLDLPPRGGPP